MVASLLRLKKGEQGVLSHLQMRHRCAEPKPLRRTLARLLVPMHEGLQMQHHPLETGEWMMSQGLCDGPSISHPAPWWTCVPQVINLKISQRRFLCWARSKMNRNIALPQRGSCLIQPSRPHRSWEQKPWGGVSQTPKGARMQIKVLWVFLNSYILNS